MGVLVTGAAGSIASELSRQIAIRRPGELIFLDQAETPLMYLELRRRFSDMELTPVVRDITDLPWCRMEATKLRDLRPGGSPP